MEEEYLLNEIFPEEEPAKEGRSGRNKKHRKKHRLLKITAAFVCCLLLGAGAAYFYFNIYRVTPAFSEITCEYGSEISRDISDYLVGTDWSVQLGDLDLSQVDESRTGVYEAAVQHGGSRFVYTVTIQDTVPPRIQWKEEQIYLSVDAVCTMDDVIEGVSDVDLSAQAFFVREGELLSEIRFDSVGQYELEIVARDLAGNETGGRVSVIVDTPPAITGTRNFYVVTGNVPDYLEEVEAWDDRDGNLTEVLQVDDSDVYLDREGVYQLRYLAVDSYGLETVETARVLVAEADDIQEMIGHRRIDYRRDVILGAPNIYDGGVSDHENLEEALDDIRPAFVQLYHPTGKGGYTSGSGYIMEISEDRIYICSNRHVVDKYEDWEIYFYDGTVAAGRTLGSSAVYDVGVAVVELADVPEDLLERLMTVHIDMTYWNELDSQAIEVALERVDREGGLIHVTMGNLVKARQKFEWYEKMYHTEVTVELVHGDSGSALVDGYGNLICMAYGFSNDPTRYWCVPLDGIVECYEEITGRVPYIY